jgi:hypothetical protein
MHSTVQFSMVYPLAQYYLSKNQYKHIQISLLLHMSTKLGLSIWEKNKHWRCSRRKYCRAYVATIHSYKTGYWIDYWIYWITHSYTQLQCIHFTLAVHYSTCRVFLHLLLTLTTESQLLLSFFRAQDLLQTQLALIGHQLTLQPSSHLRLLTWD